MPAHPITIRPVHADDDLVALTALIHAAYAPHGAQGLRYWGTHQTVADTRQRLGLGHGFVALVDGRVAGTLTLRPPQPESSVALYRAPDTWTFGQFAVDPGHKGLGIGRALHDHALAFAAARGARVMAMDTAAPALTLIALYRSWGYEVCGTADWRPLTNYTSTVMSRPIPHGDHAAAGHPARKEPA